MSFKKGFLIFKTYERKDFGFTLKKLLQLLLTPLLVLTNYPVWKHRSPFLKQKIMSLDKIVGQYDHRTLEELIKTDREYKWSSLLADIDEYGMQFIISVSSSDDINGIHPYKSDLGVYFTSAKDKKKYTRWPYHVVDGNHRIRILKALYPLNTKIKVKIYETNREIHSNKRN